ncbi:zinc finger C-x8-C-x5-C-x3-H type protein (macronuclear) [Tetrahymena thermophila SB210]|uniref:Zinc finger C-x8-C-x5-C-x3-H type protein n=1 Tax=Tetrahymena thermophila (strain SB210) TaxID=312017 RepID=I7MAD2_TETTS|nr:zinc finger C-x8-C-x5-C-x3-H type protein [Tetrahymena thermophila SB210]EAS04358.1 zinc finger C-x8-C-x5-C-x3-H type protein [Tetrahymena thermophila SB210]|eukprot:XP_001024603.1 zinc finger C-x8-C-x5-C-x3-H type protein [Tetrahymena thermophila SB210]
MNNPQSNMFNQNYFQHQQIQYSAYVKNTFQLNNSASSKVCLSNNQLPFGFPQDLLSFANKKRRESDSENMNTQFSPEAEQRCMQYQFSFNGKNQDIYSSKQHTTSQLNPEYNNYNASNLSTSTSSQSSSYSSSSQSSSSSSLQSQICSSSFLSQSNFSSTTSQQQQNIDKSKCSNAFVIDNLVQKKKNSFGSSNMNQQPLQQSQLNNLTQGPNQQETSKFKTEMCKNWMEFGKCNYGKKCQFAHGKNELVDKSTVNKRQYKSKLCNSFHTQKFCPYGNRCMFIHESRTVTEIRQSTYYQKILYNLDEQNNKIINFCELQQESKQQTPLEQQSCELSSNSGQYQPIRNTLNSSTSFRLPIFQLIGSQQKEFNISQSNLNESINA